MNNIPEKQDVPSKILPAGEEDTAESAKKKKRGIRESGMRWFILFLACNFYFGAYYCYDNFGPIETEIKKELNIDSAQYLLLYSVYSYPGCFMPVLGGMLMDSIGIRIGLFTFTLINTIG